MKLGKGDKVRIKQTGEGAEIIQVIDAFLAIVETFDGQIEVNAQQVEPFASSDSRKKDFGQIEFIVKQSVQKKQAPETFDDFNKRKNKFHYELDLHADALLQDVDQRSHEELLSIQISRFKNYLEQAIALRIQRVTIIHGIGSGRLKSEVENILSNHSQVRSYSNSYHPNYGMGATEVKLR